MFKKILGFIMAGVITVTFSLSAVAEEAFVDEAVMGEVIVDEVVATVAAEEVTIDEAVTGEVVAVDDVLDIDHVCTEDHEHNEPIISNDDANIELNTIVFISACTDHRPTIINNPKNVSFVGTYTHPYTPPGGKQVSCSYQVYSATFDTMCFTCGGFGSTTSTYQSNHSVCNS